VLEGIVLADGGPFPGGEAWLARIPPSAPGAPALTEAPRPRTERIGADGRFRFDQLEPGRHLLHVTPPGVPRYDFYFDVGEPPGRNRHVVLALGHATIEGHVFDREGRPKAGATVRLHFMTTLERPKVIGPDFAIATTDATGAYRAERLLAGQYSVHAEFEVGQAVRQQFTSATDGSPVTCDFGSSKPDSRWTGTVRRRGGAAMSGPGRLFISGVTGLEAAGPSTLAIDAEGRFSGPVPAGPHRVSVTLPPPCGTVLLEEPVTIGDSDTAKDLELPDGRIRGRLVEESTHAAPPRDGTEAAAYRVCLQRVGATVIQMDLCAKVENDGTFRFDFLPAGRYAVTSTARLTIGPRGKPGTIEVEVTDDGRDTDLVLEVR
jgi:hypothetical protein